MLASLIPAAMPPTGAAAAGSNDADKRSHPLSHKIQMVLLLESQKQDTTFINATTMMSTLTFVEEQEDMILKMVKELSLSEFHDSTKDALETQFFLIHRAKPRDLENSIAPQSLLPSGIFRKELISCAMPVAGPVLIALTCSST